MKYAFSSWSLYALLRCRIWQYGRRWKGVGLCVPVTFHAISAAESFWREQKLLSNSSKWAEILSNRRLVKRRKSCIAICRYPNPSALNVFFFFSNTAIVALSWDIVFLCQHHRRFQWCHPLLSQSLSLRHLPASQPNLAYSSGEGRESRAGVGQPAPGIVHILFKALSHSCTSQILSCVLGEGAVTGAGWPYLARVGQEENQVFGWSCDARRCVPRTLIFKMAVMKNHCSLWCCCFIKPGL